MQITAPRFTARWRWVALALCLANVSAASLQAQLRFFAPANQDPGPAEPSAVQVAQFEPTPATSPGSPTAPLDLSPQVPSAGKELSLGADIPPTPPSNSASTVEETVVPGVIESGPMESEWSGTMVPAYGDQIYDPTLAHQSEPIMYSTGDWFRRGFWYSQQDAVLLLRTEVDDIAISADNSATASATILTAKTVDPTYEPGVRLTLGRFLGQDLNNRDYTMEFTFMGLFNYSDSATLIAGVPNSLQTALVPGAVYFTNGVFGIVDGPTMEGFSDADRNDILYESDLNSFEVNFRMLGRPLRDRMAMQPNGQWIRHASSSKLSSLLLGVRGISLNELFRFNASFNADPTTLGTHQVQTQNDMYGVQLGFDLVENHANWSWGSRCKFGGLFNFANRRVKIDQLLEGQRTLQEQELNSENLAGVVEAGLMATYQIRTNLTARIAYDAMYITGIATAPNNLGLAPGFTNFEVTNDALFHGLSLGLEMLW